MSLLIKHVKYALRCVFINNVNKRKLNNNQQISLFCNNCVGGLVLHDFNLKFCTSTVNTWIPDESFIKLVPNVSQRQKKMFNKNGVVILRVINRCSERMLKPIYS